MPSGSRLDGPFGAKAADAAADVKADADADAGAAKAKQPFPWLGRVPLLPALAGLIAVGIVATAYGTSNISLNFTGGPGQPQANPQCSPDTCPDPQASDTRASRGSGRPGPISVTFANTPRTGGFRGTVTVANTGTKSLKGWTLTFSIPNAQVLSLLGPVTVVKKGTVTTIHSTHVLAPGGSAVVTFLAHGSAGDPTTCTFDQAPCPVPTP